MHVINYHPAACDFYQTSYMIFLQVKYQCPACKESKTKPLSTDLTAATKPLSTDLTAPAKTLITDLTAPDLPAATPAVPAAPVKPKEVYRHNLGRSLNKRPNLFKYTMSRGSVNSVISNLCT